MADTDVMTTQILKLTTSLAIAHLSNLKIVNSVRRLATMVEFRETYSADERRNIIASINQNLDEAFAASEDELKKLIGMVGMHE